MKPDRHRDTEGQTRHEPRQKARQLDREVQGLGWAGGPGEQSFCHRCRAVGGDGENVWGVDCGECIQDG